MNMATDLRKCIFTRIHSDIDHMHCGRADGISTNLHSTNRLLKSVLRSNIDV